MLSSHKILIEMQISQVLVALMAAASTSVSSGTDPLICIDAEDCDLAVHPRVGPRFFNFGSGPLTVEEAADCPSSCGPASLYNPVTDECYNCDDSDCTELSTTTTAVLPASSGTPYCAASVAAGLGAAGCYFANALDIAFDATTADCEYAQHYVLLLFDSYEASDCGCSPVPTGVSRMDFAATYYYDGSTCHECVDGKCDSTASAPVAPSGICIRSDDCAQNPVDLSTFTASFEGFMVHNADDCVFAGGRSYYDLSSKQCFNCDGTGCALGTGISNLPTCTVGPSSVSPSGATPYYNGNINGASCNDPSQFAEVYIVNSEAECPAVVGADLWFSTFIFGPFGVVREAIYDSGDGSSCKYCDSYSCPPQGGTCLDGADPPQELTCNTNGGDCTRATCGKNHDAFFFLPDCTDPSNFACALANCDSNYCFSGEEFVYALSMADSVEAFVAGDPHYVTWSGHKYDFHGECDTVMLHHPHFAQGKGLYIHTRTTRQGFFSFVEAAAVKIGPDVIEVNNQGQFWFNGTAHEPASLPADVAGYPLTRLVRSNGDKITYRIELDNEHHIDIQVFHHMLTVNPGNRHLLAGATGMLGDLGSGVGKHASLASHTKDPAVIQHLMQPLRKFFKHDVKRVGQVHTRDGSRILTDAYEIAAEWQVGNARDDPVLFIVAREPVYPAKCLMPVESSERRLRVSPKLREAAESACEHWGSNSDSCVFDVLATGNMELAGTF